MLNWNAMFEGYTHLEIQCFLLLISSTLFTPTFRSSVIKKRLQRPSSIVTFHQGWDVFCSWGTHLFLPLNTPFLFLFLAVFKILFQALTYFVASKIRGGEKGLWFTRGAAVSLSQQWGLQSGANFTFLPDWLIGGFLFQLWGKFKM